MALSSDRVRPLNRLIVFSGANPISYYQILGADGQMRIFGRPLMVTEKCGTLGSPYDLALVDFSAYAVGLRSETGVQTSQDEHFKRDLTSFRLISRIDGCPLYDTYLVLKDGVSKVSPYVALT